MNSGFFISQIGDKGSAIRIRADEVYQGVVRPIAQEFELTVTRSDLDPTPGQVTSHIVRSIIDSDIVIADLTGRNPNVNYELGIAHAFAKPLVILVDKIENLTFDTQSERVIAIGDNGQITVTQADVAKDGLRAALTAVLAVGYEPENLVTAVATSQSLDRLAPSNPIASELASLREVIEGIDVRTALIQRRLPRPVSTLNIRLLRGFITYLAAEGGLVTGEELRSQLITSETSEDWDSWVFEEAARLDEVSARAAEDAAASSGYVFDEEPF